MRKMRLTPWPVVWATLAALVCGHSIIPGAAIAAVPTETREAAGAAPKPATRAADDAPDDNDAVDDATALPDAIELPDYLVLPAVGHYGRLPLHQDAVEAMLVSGQWQPPSPGTSVETADGQQKEWRVATASDGDLETRTVRGGYALAQFESAAERVMLLEAAGHAAVYVNGKLRAGDPYRLGWLRLPVLLRPGENSLLFHVASDQLSASLTAPRSEVFFMDDDRTLPTLVRGENDPIWGAVAVVNATQDWLDDLALECQSGDGEPLVTSVGSIAPLAARKLAFRIPAGSNGATGQVLYDLRLTRKTDHGDPLAISELALDVVGPSDVHVRTFRSRIDGSVQPYAVRAAANGNGSRAGMIVTLHDAAVSCAEHAAQLAAKDWAHVVAPQGRRPQGFDWEDWGRIDVLEALSDARRRYLSDPRRTYLTGHAMGGHGTWHLGVTYPDMFAGLGPCAGWASFWSYGGGMPAFQNPNRLEALLLRGYLPSDTVQLLTNVAETGIYVLHGASDEHVPIAQARFMRSRLAGFHPNFAYYENPDADLWLESEGCDWPPMMEFFKRLKRPAPEERSTVDFTTADPGVSSRCDWLRIEAQKEPFKLSRAAIRQDVDTRTFVGQTSNVARLAIDVRHLPPGQTIDVALDGQQLPALPWPAEASSLWFQRSGNQWQAGDPPSPRLKNPNRNGTFKSALHHDVLLVYGTGGTEDEDQWALTKARYDAETFWYRGNGSLDIVPDTRLVANDMADRNVILYGNADTNSAWSELLAGCPVQVRRGQVRVGARTLSGDDLAVLMVYPREGSEQASVGVVAGTGPTGAALTNRLRYFISGIAYPDLMIVEGDSLLQGTLALRAWGYFGPDWSIETGEVAWRDGS